MAMQWIVCLLRVVLRHCDIIIKTWLLESNKSGFGSQVCHYLCDLGVVFNLSELKQNHFDFNQLSFTPYFVGVISILSALPNLKLMGIPQAMNYYPDFTDEEIVLGQIVSQ